LTPFLFSLQFMKQFALITGGAGGIGLSFAKICAKEGYPILLVDINKENLEKAQEEILSLSDTYEVKVLNQDLSIEGAAQIIFDYTKENELQIDLLFNNAGFGNFGYFSDSSWTTDRAMLQVHMITSTQLMKLYIPEMLSRKSGYILNNASVAAFVPAPLHSTYHASKSYLLNLSQALANEVKSSGINIAVLCPGMTKTNFAKANGNEDPNIKFNIATSDDVALMGYESLMKGKVVIVPGIWNKLSAFLPRILSRKKVTNMVGNIQRKNHAKRADDKAIKNI